ncbi:unnamed protein product [Tilletia controversa]|uniref:Uncharacterized protein n=3 Tax=Tilletia TaxID=13289 RepID=A0A8X7MSD9_9BASI|nr:hypothetical protein CF336_g4035 [Tilletia laevis]KAE8197036.1 hypothetical protein CF328_g3963 [Tilletia controversa]KAE8260902.1 hypothetical protein A4X03_0g3664 [Tilletia caries]KAE8202258.1 hypothetical protein CF335_g3490 [Tilletia laevis]KAE8247135.1 hypothetical protein A4X06_0g4676 [Tilletia controversa]
MRLVQLSLSTFFLAVSLVEARNMAWIHDCSVKAFKFCPLGPRFNAEKWQAQYYHCMCDNWRTIDGGWYTCSTGCYRDSAGDLMTDFDGDYHKLDAYCASACGGNDDCPANWHKC